MCARSLPVSRSLLLVALAAVSCLLIPGASHYATVLHLRRSVAQAQAREQALPRRMVWVWERPEDLHTLDPATMGVAVLAKTLRLGSGVQVVGRRQPLLLPPGITQLAVVRLEAASALQAHREDRALLRAAVAELLEVASRPGVAALQVDFDARRSEHLFYRALLTELRQRMPATLPLEITALVSWCSTDDWIGDLPVNAATPMFFRMEPDRRRLALETWPAYRLREPLCQSTVGVSTGEPWPRDLAGKRIFVFADHGWSQDGPTLRLLSSSFTPQERR